MARQPNSGRQSPALPLRLSGRVPGSRAANALSELRQQLEAEGHSVLDLCGSNPTACGLGDWSVEIADALRQAEAARYLPTALGSRKAREAVAMHYACQRVDVDVDAIVLSASSSESYSFLFQVLCNPGDEVLTPTPSYPLLDHLVALSGVRQRQYRLWYTGEWRIDFASLEAGINERTRAIVVVNPNNPTGSYLLPFEAEHLLALCASRGLVLIADEVFWEYAVGEASGYPRFAGAACEATVVSLGGLSKSAGMPQMKLGWMVLGGGEAGCAELREGLRWVADSYLSVSAPVQVALPRLLEIGGEIQLRILERMRANVDLLKAWAAGTETADLLTLEGGWSATLRLPPGCSDHAWCETLLRLHTTWMQPGYFYDYSAGSYVVLSLLTECEKLREGLSRLGEELGRIR